MASADHPHPTLFLKGKGFDVTEKVIAGAAHCAFDAHGEAMAVWGRSPGP